MFVQKVLLHFWNLDNIFNNLKKTIAPIADAFRKLCIPKKFVRLMSKKSRFGGPFDKQHGEWDQTVLKSAWHLFYHIYWSLWKQLSSIKSVLVIGKTLRLFFNTLTAGHKFSLLNRDNLMEPIQMESSLKRKKVSEMFAAILKCRSNFERFQRKMTLIADVIWKLRTPKTVVR